MQTVGKEQVVVSKLSPYSPAFWPAYVRWQRMEQEESRPKFPDEAQRHRQSAESIPVSCSAAVQLAFVQGLPVPVCTTTPDTVAYSQLVQGGYTAGQPAYVWLPVSTAQTLLQTPIGFGVHFPHGMDDRSLPGIARLRLTGAHRVWRPVRHRQPSSPRTTNHAQHANSPPVSLEQQLCGPYDSSAHQSEAGHKAEKEHVQQVSAVSGRASPEDESVASDPESNGEDSKCAAECAAQRRRFEAQAEPSYGTGWDSITEPVMQMIVQRLDPRSQQLCRLVSKRWNYYVTNNLQVVQPKRPKVHTIRENFRSLTSLDLSACENVRNRNMAILAASDLRLKSIAIGHVATLAYGKPRVTNSALTSLSKISTITHLSLADCSAITNNGMQVMCALTNLESLAFIRCPRISEKGLELLGALPRLLSLTVFGCSKVAEDLLDVVGNVPQLESLHLGHMRLQAERLGGLTKQTALRELTIHGEELTPGSLAALGRLTRLTALGMTTCYQVSAPVALTVLSDMTNIQRLNVQSFGDLRDAHLTQIASRLVHLRQLKVVLGLNVTRAGVEALTSLCHLHAISMESVQASPMALRAISKLTQLTVAEFPGTSLPPQLLDALSKLPKLEVLNLSNFEPQNMLRNERPISVEDLQALTRCTNLKRLDLSHLGISFQMASDLLTRIMERDAKLTPKRESPLLQELCLSGCPIEGPQYHTRSKSNLERLNAMYPLTHSHQNRRRVLPSSTWIWDQALHA